MCRALAVRFGGLPHSHETVDAPPPEVAADISRLWLRNTFVWRRARVVDEDARSVVSLTTHGRRIEDVWLAIESIGRGTVRPRRIILWLDDADVRLPHRVRRLRRRGLEVLRTPHGLGVHTKYQPYIRTQPLKMPLVLADDDIIYPPEWLLGLERAYAESPGHVIAYRAHIVGMNEDGSFQPYRLWRSCDDSSASFAHFATSVSGQLLAPSLQVELLRQGDAFLEHAPTADDVWLHRTAVLAGYRTRQVDEGQRHWWFIPGSQTTGLNTVNVGEGGNDRQIDLSHTEVTRNRIRADIEADRLERPSR